MGKPNYRVLVSFDRERNLFHARTHELEHLSGEGGTRADAIARLEEEIDAQLANMLSSGTPPPRAIDDVEHSGEVQAKVSRGLHRDLLHLARAEGVELGQLVSELLASALALRQGGARGARPGRPQAHEAGDDIGNRADGNRRSFGRGGYGAHALDDRAHFIEYVRGLEQGGQGGQGHAPGNGPRGNGNGGGYPGGGHPGGGHPGGGRRNRRGGRGGPPQHQGRDGNRGPNHPQGRPRLEHGPGRHDAPPEPGNGAAPPAPHASSDLGDGEP